MNTDDFNVTKERIRQCADKWITPLGLKWWTVRLEYDKERCTEQPGSRACTHVLWEYLDATITFHMPELVDDDDAELERTFVHECCHILVAEMRDYSETRNGKHEERAVTGLTKAFQWVYDLAYNAGKARPKKDLSYAIEEVEGVSTTLPELE